MFETEQAALGKYLPGLGGDVAVQYSLSGSSALLQSSNIEQKYLLLEGRPENSLKKGLSPPTVDCELYIDSDSALPFQSSSIDLCLLPHMLEYSSNPHGLLRDSKEILVSGGHLVILGFNPYSLWGARKLFSSTKYPWNYSYCSLYKMRDWLSLLDFSVVGGMMLYYSPPVENQSLRGKFSFLEKAGDRWWPMLAGVYLLVAQKRDFGTTVIDLSARASKRSFVSVAEPVAKNNLIKGRTGSRV